MPSMMASRICYEEAAEESNTLNNSNMEEMKKGRITPSWIDSLKENEIFVFGSNLAGMHGGGAARIARLHFGAVMGQGVGCRGRVMPSLRCRAAWKPSVHTWMIS